MQSSCPMRGTRRQTKTHFAPSAGSAWDSPSVFSAFFTCVSDAAGAFVAEAGSMLTAECGQWRAAFHPGALAEGFNPSEFWLGVFGDLRRATPLRAKANRQSHRVQNLCNHPLWKLHFA